MNFLTILAQAGATTAPAAKQHPPAWYDFASNPMLPITVGFLILYFFFINSKKKGDRKRQDLLKNLKRGDRVQTIGGVLGTVVEARDNEVIVKVDEGNNTKIKFTRNAINRVILEDDKTETK
ncbi:MAG: YajC family protein [Phycisphaerales bacterium]|jgi:preprotein translocase subunit YajC|nr:YajC family protein [Phycisphaerales bacterium]MDB5299158.1 YajC family protein [Phycisphaerales bacterium]MDB5302636.1 YajC family protein [Phycisphaerales bacterium]